jgi:hypothetical protein
MQVSYEGINKLFTDEKVPDEFSSGTAAREIPLGIVELI